MRRLIEKGLMYGGLVHIASPALAARYARALRKLNGRETALTDFHIDVSGFSPEVAEEQGDALYMNPGGVNRQFIVLTTDQKTAPLLGASFSTDRTILRTFIEDSEPQLFALTTRDAVMGELVNAVWDASTPARILDIREVTVEADTTGGHVGSAQELAEKIARFKTEAGAWHDDVLVAEMIELARQTGDVTRAPVALPRPTFDVRDFWTSHHGGMYVFRSVPEPSVISMSGPVDVPIYNIAASDRNTVAAFLLVNELVEPLVKAKGTDAAAILQQKMDFVLVDVAAERGIDLSRATRQQFRAIARRHAAELPPEFEALAALQRWASSGGPWPRIASDHPAYFYTLRARPGPLRDLVNRMLAELSPKDVRQLFICHKEAFYAAYATWPDEKREYVASFLEREYQVDKAGTRLALFGPEEPMEEPQPVPTLSPAERPRPARAEPRPRPRGPWG